MEKSKKYTNKLLTLAVKEDSNSISIEWQGRSKERNPSIFLTPILTRILERSKIESKKIIMDFTKLEYMNSSTITPIIKILERMKKGSNHILIQYGKALKWQELTFAALEAFQTDDQRVKIEGI